MQTLFFGLSGLAVIVIVAVLFARRAKLFGPRTVLRALRAEHFRWMLCEFTGDLVLYSPSLWITVQGRGAEQRHYCNPREETGRTMEPALCFAALTSDPLVAKVNSEIRRVMVEIAAPETAWPRLV